MIIPNQERSSGFSSSTRPVTKIKIVGVGGGGGNAVNRMISENRVYGVDYVAMNTDRAVLEENKALVRIQIGDRTTRGQGAGGNPEVGQKAAMDSAQAIMEAIDDADLVFVTAGMGGGTGTGAAPVVAKIAKDAGKLVIGVVTTPFEFEGKERRNYANQGIGYLKEQVDALVIINNENLNKIARNMLFNDAFGFADNGLCQCVLGISDVISKTATINLDFADVCTTLRKQGLAYAGIGSKTREDRDYIIEAVKEAVNNQLYDYSIEDATNVIVFLSCNKDSITVNEVNTAVNYVRDVVSPDANVMFGVDFFDPQKNGKKNYDVMVTIIAAGLGRDYVNGTIQKINTQNNNGGRNTSQSSHLTVYSNDRNISDSLNSQYRQNGQNGQQNPDPRRGGNDQGGMPPPYGHGGGANNGEIPHTVVTPINDLNAWRDKINNKASNKDKKD